MNHLPTGMESWPGEAELGTDGAETDYGAEVGPEEDGPPKTQAGLEGAGPPVAVQVEARLVGNLPLSSLNAALRYSELSKSVLSPLCWNLSML